MIYLLYFVVGALVGALITGSTIFAVNKNKKSKTIKAMKDYIQELEHKNDELTEMYNRQREAFIRLS